MDRLTTEPPRRGLAEPTGLEPYPSAWSAWAAVLVFFIAQVAATVDRGMLALVIDPIRRDLRISDVQIALLQGFAFAVFYTTVGLPIGAVADRISRRKLLMAGVAVWSAATVFGGLAQNFQQMFASRVLIGFGEAVLAPCAVTLLSDLFPPHRRGRPMALYVLGSMIAYGIGSLVTGVILGVAPKGVFDRVPLLGHLAYWRLPFVLIGSFGVVIVFLIFLLKETPRRGVALERASGLGIVPAAAFLKAHWRVFLPFYAALATYGLGISTANGWGAVLLTRVYGFKLAAAGQALGVAQIAAATLGALCASVIVDRVARRGGTRGKMVFGGLLALLSIPATLAWLAPTGGVAVIMIGEVVFASAMFGSTMLSTITEMVPVGMKGLSVALYAFVVTMIGSSLGPVAVAGLTEHVFGDPHMVGRSMAVVGVSALTASALLAWIASLGFKRELGRVEAFAALVGANAA